jgi:hypothetical protein
MTMDELYRQLCEAELGNIAQRHPLRIAMQDYEIEHDGDIFRVCEKERAFVIRTYLETGDEAEACRYYLHKALKFVWHLTRSPDQALTDRQQEILTAAGITVERDDLPGYVSPGGVPHYRIFIAGAHFKQARQLLGL